MPQRSRSTRQPEDLDRPSAGEFVRLHRRLAGGDQSAAEGLSEALLRLLTRRLRRAFSSTTEDAITDAAEDAILEYLRAPSRFDESRGVPLDCFLYRSARCNLVSLLRAEGRRHAREARYGAEQAAASAAVDQAQDEVATLPPAIRARLLESAVNDGERTALALLLDGECGTEPLARALGVGDVLGVDQRREVKRFRDRVLKRLARLLHRAVKRSPVHE